MRKNWIMVSLLAALALFVGGFLLIGNHTKTSDPRGTTAVAAVQTAKLIGTWTQSNVDGGVQMTATITDGKISIDMHTSADTSGTYWVGTFDTNQTSSNFTVHSVGDKTAMERSILASQATTKDFTYRNGDLSFEFKMLGITKTVHMQRSSE